VDVINLPALRLSAAKVTDNGGSMDPPAAQLLRVKRFFTAT
jgi:hypothetical protein